MDNKHDILALLRGVAAGETAPEEALLKLKEAPFEDLGYAKVDFHRAVRQGSAEVIYGAGKTPEQIAGIAADLQRVERAETALHALGFRDFRVRLFHGLARVQVPEGQMALALERREEILAALKDFDGAVLDLKAREA